MTYPLHTVPSFQADRRLWVVQPEKGDEALMYLGYPLRLSPDEARLLRILLEADPAQADAQGYTAVDTVLGAMRSSIAHGDPNPFPDSFPEPSPGPRDPRPRLPYSKEQIAILASRVNRKAMAIGGRKLILGKSHHGYRVNPYM